uniref:Citrate lyase subunit alpha n=1 Tax=candidate division WOR-3 bacterium TaxID=2052148 RepID=A0A7V3PUG3_UNCW3
MNLVPNALNRLVPTEVNGRPAVPFPGVDRYKPSGRKAAPKIPTVLDYPRDGNKVVKDLRTALELCGIKDGMTISTHHHFRDGDTLALQLFDTCAEMGLKDLVWFPSAAFPCHAPLIKHLDSGVIHHIEGSLNGPLGDYCTAGKMRGLGVLRSHGGRAQAIQDGEVHIDIAVIAAPTADPFGNANAVNGNAACGVLGYAQADAMYADRVIVVTNNLVPFPCIPIEISGGYVDYVVVQDSIGDPKKIVSGTTELTRSPDRLYISELVARFIRDAGIMRNGFSFQAGAGGISLAFAVYLAQMMKDAGVKAGWIHGGTNRFLVKMLEEGLTAALVDGQAFDLEAVRSIGVNRNHIGTAPIVSYNHHSKGNYINLMDVVVLGATEVDLNFNANVVTHSDGRLLHGIGGWQNCLYARCVILAMPAVRDRIPVIVDEVTTLCGPGEMIDVVVTELGIAINPKREDLIAAVKGKNLPLKSLEQMKAEVERLGGKPKKPERTSQVVAVVKWVDGTVLDSVFKLPERY